MLTLLELSDVTGKPKVKLDLPAPLRVGERIRLAFHLRRHNGGRSEVLEVNGEFKVTAIGLDLAIYPHRQILTIDSVGVVPHWKAVKRRGPISRVLPPARAARKTIE